jgi:hypothetical protein
MQEILKKLEIVKSEANWRNMPLTILEEHFIQPILQLSEEDTMLLVTSLTPRTFDWFRKKLWTVQDLPEEADGYNKTIHIVTVLKRLLLFRISITDSPAERSGLTQQLAHASLILSPTLIANALPNGHDDEDDQDDGEDDDDEEENDDENED